MSKSKTLKIRFKSLNDLEEELVSFARSKKGFVQPSDVILFESVAGFRNFLTLQKLEILTLIASKKPKSVYDLAVMVGRSIAPVQKDCKALVGAGFIYLERQHAGRGAQVPVLKFNYDKILVELPKFPYELAFRSVA